MPRAAPGHHPSLAPILPLSQGEAHLLEHPEDPTEFHGHSDEWPTFWITDQAADLLSHGGGRQLSFDQCRHGHLQVATKEAFEEAGKCGRSQ